MMRDVSRQHDAVCMKRPQRRSLILFHASAVAFDIGDKNGRKLSLTAVRIHCGISLNEEDRWRRAPEYGPVV